MNMEAITDSDQLVNEKSSEADYNIQIESEGSDDADNEIIEDETHILGNNNNRSNLSTFAASEDVDLDDIDSVSSLKVYKICKSSIVEHQKNLDKLDPIKRKNWNLTDDVIKRQKLDDGNECEIIEENNVEENTRNKDYTSNIFDAENTIRAYYSCKHCKKDFSSAFILCLHLKIHEKVGSVIPVEETNNPMTSSNTDTDDNIHNTKIEEEKVLDENSQNSENSNESLDAEKTVTSNLVPIINKNFVENLKKNLSKAMNRKVK